MFAGFSSKLDPDYQVAETWLRFDADANTQVTRLPVEEAVKRHGQGGALFVDVRDSAAIAKTGTISGAVTNNGQISPALATDATGAGSLTFTTVSRGVTSTP